MPAKTFDRRNCSSRLRWEARATLFVRSPCRASLRNERNCHGLVFVIVRCRRRTHMAYEERETGNLIGSDKVEGTAVYGADNQRIGSIERVMIDKISGNVAYAVLGFGGFLGIGDDHASVAIAQIRHQPWRLRYGYYRKPAERGAKVQ